MRIFAVCVAAVLGYVCANPTGYLINESNGIGYKLIYQAQPWEKAKQICAEDGGKLAVPKTEEEFQFIQKLVRGMQYHEVIGAEYKLLVWLGVNNLDNYRVWRTVDGENLEDAGFSRWSGNNGNGFSDSPAEPHCVGMDAHNPGYRDFWCHRHQPYVCQTN